MIIADPIFIRFKVGSVAPNILPVINDSFYYLRKVLANDSIKLHDAAGYCWVNIKWKCFLSVEGQFSIV